jgi:hypothetical protein
MTGDLIDLAALGADGEHRTRNRLIITDTAGVPVAESFIVPRLFVHRSTDAQRKLPPLPAAERDTALTKAAGMFVSSTIAGLDFDSYVDLTCRVTGLPIVAARAVAHTVAESVTTAYDAVRPARPSGATPDWRDVSNAGGAVWARREQRGWRRLGTTWRRARSSCARQRARLEAVFAADDHLAVLLTWSVYQRMIAAYCGRAS